MAPYLLQIVSVLFIILPLCTALQFAPGSPCSNVCIDNINNDPTNPANSNTTGTDLTCTNADYTTTSDGKKFLSCVNCLQTSTFATTSESDQGWFIYNLRYTLDWCLFGYPNNPEPLSGPCMTSVACGAVSQSLESGALNPLNGSTYDYCTANGGSFQNSLAQCTSCIQQMSSSNYLANFLTALKAGCQQQPSSGKLIGLDGSLFSSIPVNITSPTTPSAATVSSNNPDGLSIGAKVGIGIGAILLILIIASVIFICIKKRRVRHLSSSYHPRFGAVEISAPTKGAFTSPSFLPVTDTIPFVLRRQQSQQSSDDSFDLEKLAKKLSRPVSNVTSFSSGTTTRDSSPNIKTCAFDRSVTQPPVHQAYIPGAYADHAISPATSISNNPWMVHSSTRPTTRQSLNTITQPAPTLSRETSIKTHVSNLQGRNRSQSPPSATSLGRQQSLRIPAYGCLPPVEGIKEQSPDSAHSVEQWPGQM